MSIDAANSANDELDVMDWNSSSSFNYSHCEPSKSPRSFVKFPSYKQVLELASSLLYRTTPSLSPASTPPTSPSIYQHGRHPQQSRLAPETAFDLLRLIPTLARLHTLQLDNIDFAVALALLSTSLEENSSSTGAYISPSSSFRDSSSSSINPNRLSRTSWKHLTLTNVHLPAPLPSTFGFFSQLLQSSAGQMMPKWFGGNLESLEISVAGSSNVNACNVCKTVNAEAATINQLHQNIIINTHINPPNLPHHLLHRLTQGGPGGLLLPCIILPTLSSSLKSLVLGDSPWQITDEDVDLLNARCAQMESFLMVGCISPFRNSSGLLRLLEGWGNLQSVSFGYYTGKPVVFFFFQKLCRKRTAFIDKIS
jgi:hypothetical protein